MTNEYILHDICINCIHFDCEEDENGRCVKHYCKKGHEWKDDKTTTCKNFAIWETKWEIEKSSKYENSWWKEIK